MTRPGAGWLWRIYPTEFETTREPVAVESWWRKRDRRRSAEVLIDPPTAVAQVILHRQGEWRFPTVIGVITTPTLRPDGSLLVLPGYDRKTRLILVDPPPMPAIRHYPSSEGGPSRRRAPSA